MASASASAPLASSPSPRRYAELGEVEEQQGLPNGALRKRRAPCECTLSELTVAGLGGQQLEDQEIRDVVGSRFRCFFGQRLRPDQVVLVIDEEERTLDESA